MASKTPYRPQRMSTDPLDEPDVGAGFVLRDLQSFKSEMRSKWDEVSRKVQHNSKVEEIFVDTPLALYDSQAKVKVAVMRLEDNVRKLTTGEDSLSQRVSDLEERLQAEVRNMTLHELRHQSDQDEHLRLACLDKEAVTDLHQRITMMEDTLAQQNDSIVRQKELIKSQQEIINRHQELITQNQKDVSRENTQLKHRIHRLESSHRGVIAALRGRTSLPPSGPPPDFGDDSDISVDSSDEMVQVEALSKSTAGNRIDALEVLVLKLQRSLRAAKHSVGEISEKNSKLRSSVDRRFQDLQHGLQSWQTEIATRLERIPALEAHVGKQISDVTSINEKSISALQEKVRDVGADAEERLRREIDCRLALHEEVSKSESHVARLEDKLAACESLFPKLEQKLEKVTERVGKNAVHTEERVASVVGRVATLEDKQARLITSNETQDSAISSLQDGVSHLNSGFTRMEEAIDVVGNDVSNLARVTDKKFEGTDKFAQLVSRGIFAAVSQLPQPEDGRHVHTVEVIDGFSMIGRQVARLCPLIESMAEVKKTLVGVSEFEALHTRFREDVLAWGPSVRAWQDDYKTELDETNKRVDETNERVAENQRNIVRSLDDTKTVLSEETKQRHAENLTKFQRVKEALLQLEEEAKKSRADTSGDFAKVEKDISDVLRLVKSVQDDKAQRVEVQDLRTSCQQYWSDLSHRMDEISQETRQEFETMTQEHARARMELDMTMTNQTSMQDELRSISTHIADVERDVAGDSAMLSHLKSDMEKTSSDVREATHKLENLEIEIRRQPYDRMAPDMRSGLPETGRPPTELNSDV
eukprot:Rmarinus@m.22204